MNPNTSNPSVVDYIKNYLHNEYLDDLHFIFQLDYEREDERRPWLCDFNAADAKMKSNIRAVADPMRHFVFSSIFLVQLVSNIAIWDDKSFNGYDRSKDGACEDLMDFSDFVEFHKRSKWPDFGIDIWKEFSPCFSQKKLDDMKEIMDRYGLMTTYLNNGYQRFLLACIVDVLQIMLLDELMDLDVSWKVCDRISERANEYSKSIFATLFK